jgi:hypothetical protein
VDERERILELLARGQAYERVHELAPARRLLTQAFDAASAGRTGHRACQPGGASLPGRGSRASAWLWRSAASELLGLAGGECDAFLGFGLSPWDTPAGVAIVRACGGTTQLVRSPIGVEVLVAAMSTGRRAGQLGRRDRPKLTGTSLSEQSAGEWQLPRGKCVTRPHFLGERRLWLARGVPWWR